MGDRLWSGPFLYESGPVTLEKLGTVKVFGHDYFPLPYPWSPLSLLLDDDFYNRTLSKRVLKVYGIKTVVLSTHQGSCRRVQYLGISIFPLPYHIRRVQLTGKSDVSIACEWKRKRGGF